MMMVLVLLDGAASVWAFNKLIITLTPARTALAGDSVFKQTD